jgi:transposase-like protein
LERDDAVLAKKPLEGWKCATCDKNLVNMIGMPAEHYTWNRMPKKNGERIPMMGQGFSRMLMTLNHNQSTSNLEKQSKTFYSPREEEEPIDESMRSSRNEKVTV